MALSRLKNWGTEILTDTDLEAEFDNIYNNALTLVSPATGNLSMGGFHLTTLSLGSAASPSVQFTGDTNTGIFSSGADSVNISVGSINAYQVTLSGGITQAQLSSTEAGNVGPSHILAHLSASPADNDLIGLIDFRANDDGATLRVVGRISCKFEDVSAATMDSSLVFQVMNAVNAGDINTSATLSSLGVWTDSSAGIGKAFVDDPIDDVLGKLRSLPVGKYHGRGVPNDRADKAEHHYSCTAEDFFQVFGLGNDPARGTPGIAPKDVAFLAVKAVLELEARVATLEAA